MIFRNILRRFRKMKGIASARPVEYVHEYAGPHEAFEDPGSQAYLGEVDFSNPGDLEAYVDSLTVPREVIEHWISAGLLLPQEMKVAEKITKIMRKREHANPREEGGGFT